MPTDWGNADWYAPTYTTRWDNLTTTTLENTIYTANDLTGLTFVTREEVKKMLEDYTRRIYVAIQESAKLDVTEDEFINLVKEIR